MTSCLAFKSETDASDVYFSREGDAPTLRVSVCVWRFHTTWGGRRWKVNMWINTSDTSYMWRLAGTYPLLWRHCRFARVWCFICLTVVLLSYLQKGWRHTGGWAAFFSSFVCVRLLLICFPENLCFCCGLKKKEKHAGLFSPFTRTRGTRRLLGWSSKANQKGKLKRSSSVLPAFTGKRHSRRRIYLKRRYCTVVTSEDGENEGKTVASFKHLDYFFQTCHL